MDSRDLVPIMMVAVGGLVLYEVGKRADAALERAKKKLEEFGKGAKDFIAPDLHAPRPPDMDAPPADRGFF